MKRYFPIYEEFLNEAANDKKLRAESEKLYQKLVPGSGKADTVEGEMIRAINKLIYRWWNDGDKFFIGYGCETVGPVAAYFRHSKYLDRGLQAKIKKLINKAEDEFNDKKYEAAIFQILELIVDYVKSKGDNLTKNKEDMYDHESDWADWDDADDEWDEYEGRYR